MKTDEYRQDWGEGVLRISVTSAAVSCYHRAALVGEWAIRPDLGVPPSAALFAAAQFLKVMEANLEKPPAPR